MNKYYSDEGNIQILLALLKEHGIRKVIASPGNTNLTLVVSMQHDSFFEIYSSVDERSAAYMACGLAAESGEPVIISCTGATASRNYMPGLTEAYYRKLPILAITSSRSIAEIGHHVPQVIDRRVIPNDIAKLSISLPIVKDDNDKWECGVKINQALLELNHRGKGPVHINLPTIYSSSYTTKELPKVRVINRILIEDIFPDFPMEGRIAVFCGAHPKWTEEQTDILDRFCASNNAVVFCDHTSNYKGKYRMLYSLVTVQEQFVLDLNINVFIHIGEISGDYFTSLESLKGKEVWRVNEDGEVRDTFRRLRYVFEMPESVFFKHYIKDNKQDSDSYFQTCQSLYSKIYEAIPTSTDLPFSNIWIAYKMAKRIPENSIIHFGILNSLRSWNFFELPRKVFSDSNVGGFGIDGSISSLIGASLVNEDKLYFGVVGDLAFFYDMNAIGNLHVGNNLRILLINNGIGSEFKLYFSPGARLGDDANKYVAAEGHYGNKSRILVKHYAEDLGFEYLSATNKQEFEQVYEQFLSKDLKNKPLLFEVFTNHIDESNALKSIRNILKNKQDIIKQMAKKVVGQKMKEYIKKTINS